MSKRILILLLCLSLPCFGLDNYKKVNISTATTTVVKPTPGTVHRLIIGTPVVSATIKFYDVGFAGCSGTPSSGADAFFTLGSSASNFIPQSIVIDMIFDNGICVVTSQATNIDVTYE